MKSIDYIDKDLFSPKTAWDKLSIREKADVIRAGVSSGYTKIHDIRKGYNEFAEGGDEDILKRVNSSDADFVQRLQDPDRQAITDWETGDITTHKLSVGTDNEGNNYVYPEVQRINGKLVDFTRPPYNRYAGRKSAEQRGDTVRVSSLDDAIRFTQNYKQYYPKGNTFDMGGAEDPGLGNTNLPFIPGIIASRLNNRTRIALEEPVVERQDTISPSPAPINWDEVKQRQAFMETEFNDKAVSPTGATGRWQIMPNTLNEYTKKTGNTGELVNPEFNGQVRDWYMGTLLDRSWVTKGEASDSIQWGKALAAYNYGPTNVVNALNEAKRQGVDIYNSWDWLEHMPLETRNYVNFVLRNKDINKYKNQERYDKAVNKLNKRELGGPLIQQANI